MGMFWELFRAALGGGALLGPVLGGFLASSGNYNNLLLCVGGLVIVSITGFSVLARKPVFTRPATG
jgi:hypothetical protein